MAKLYAVLKAYDIVGEIVSIVNEPIVCVKGGFMRESGQPTDWKIDGVVYPWEVGRVTCEIMGQIAEMPCPQRPDKDDSRVPGNVFITIGPLLMRMTGEEEAP